MNTEHKLQENEEQLLIKLFELELSLLTQEHGEFNEQLGLYSDTEETTHELEESELNE